MSERFEQLEFDFPDPARIVRERRRPWGVTDFARTIGCSRFTILRAINSGLLEARNIGHGQQRKRFVIDPAVAFAYFQNTQFDPNL